MTTESKKVQTVEDAMVRAGLPFASTILMQGSYFKVVPVESSPKDEYGGDITYHWFEYESQKLILGTSISGVTLMFEFTGENESWVLLFRNEPVIVTLTFPQTR